MNHLLPEGDPVSGDSQKPNNLLRVGTYVRKSNKTEGRSKSIPEQIQFCEQVDRYYGFAKGNVEIYDEAEGYKGEYYWQDAEGKYPKPWRPALTRLINDILSDKIDVVQVWRSDRLYRDAGVCDALMKIFRAKGVRFICGNRDMDINSATGLYQASVEAANNRKYRDTVSEDIRRDQDFKAEIGMFSRNPSCFGFRSKGKGSQAVEPIWEEIDLVNRIFRLFVHGEDDRGPLGINAIANLLMDEGISIAVGAKGHEAKNPEKIHTSQIRTILTNCMYIAKWRHKRREYDNERLLVPARDGSGKLETAVPVALYEAAQEKLKLTDRPGKKSAYSDHLLSGLVICAYCGRPLHVHYDRRKGNDPSKEVPHWYICNNRKPPRYCKPYGMRMLQEDVLDDWVMKELAPLIMLEIEEIRSCAGRDADVQLLAGLEAKIADLTKKETNTIKDMIGILDTEQITHVAADFRAQREQLQRKIEEVRPRVNSNIDMPDLSAEALSKMPKQAIKDALRRAVQWIAIGKDGVVVLTSLGTYISATFRLVPKGTYYTSETRTTIYPPTPADTLKCLKYLPSLADFIKGRRDSTGKHAEKLTDEEILPGFGSLNDNGAIEAEVQVIVEEIQLNN